MIVLLNLRLSGSLAAVAATQPPPLPPLALAILLPLAPSCTTKGEVLSKALRGCILKSAPLAVVTVDDAEFGALSRDCLGGVRSIKSVRV